MTDIVEKGIKEFEDLFENNERVHTTCGYKATDWLRSYSHSLIEEVGKEVIGENGKIASDKGINVYEKIRCDLRSDQRTKLKEMIGGV
jgi:hypothetical protein